MNTLSVDPDPVVWRVDAAPIPYPEALAEMDRRAAAIRAGSEPELVWLLEHPPLYTGGTSAKAGDLAANPGLPVFDAGRGGQFTYHGPGQRIAYVLLDLKRRGGDVRGFVRSLEGWIVAALADCGVAGERREGRVGIWVDRGPYPLGGRREDKIAAIGVRIRHWVTFHGLSINVDCDLSHYAGIVPCGISDARYGVTSLAALGRPERMPALDAALRRRFAASFPPPR